MQRFAAAGRGEQEEAGQTPGTQVVKLQLDDGIAIGEHTPGKPVAPIDTPAQQAEQAVEV